ncbi:MAG: FCD domain-containing protein [Gammaproteobacteria bacterium]|nr:FCD domain-containing protein [Gammaproteobacteria bacterium]
MSPETIHIVPSRRTAADELFSLLRADIESLRLTPGTKLSEADVAKRYNVSRQPVREAFIRLGDISLVSIRPQKATTVARISKSEIVKSRFIRLAIELEIARTACLIYRGELDDEIQAILDRQEQCAASTNFDHFRQLDYQFHKLICKAAGREFAFQVIEDCKVKVDRLCILELSSKADASQTLADHQEMFKHLKANNESGLVEATKKHLSRLDETIEANQKKFSDFFEE